MQTITQHTKLTTKNHIITIGSFDGVHLGHVQVLKELKKKSIRKKIPSVIFTFSPHPKSILEENSKIKLLQSFDEKIERLEKYGIDYLFVQKFDEEFAATSFDDFVNKILIEKLKMKTLLLGYDNHFGKNQEGNFEHLSEIMPEIEIKKSIPIIICNEKISSSKIRNYIEAGNIYIANKMLGYDYFIQGKVVAGKGVGRKLGFPTANVKINDEKKIIPKNGVYETTVIINNNQYKAVCNIGFQPTIAEDNKRTIEVHIIDFDKNIYGEKIKLLFLKRIRDEKKFETTKELISAIKKDLEHNCVLSKN